MPPPKDTPKKIYVKLKDWLPVKAEKHVEIGYVHSVEQQKVISFTKHKNYLLTYHFCKNPI